MTKHLSRRSALIVVSSALLPALANAQVNTPRNSDPLTAEITGVVLPVARDGVLVSFLFCAIVIQVRDAASTLFFRENHFLLRDAIVRIASRSPIPAGPTPESFDRVAITRVVLRAIQAIRPNAQVVRITAADAAFMRN
jgi:hypothetical protein